MASAMMHDRGQAAGVELDPATRAVMPDQRVTSVHLLRHGSVVHLEERVVRGQADVELSPAGREQSRRLARWLAAHEPAPDVLVGSDLGRCRELGELLAERSRVRYDARSELREQHMGAWQGRTWAEVTREDARRVSAYWSDYAGVAPPGGESFADLVTRVVAWWEGARPACDGRRVWIVTHVGVIRAFACHWLGVAPSHALRFAPAAASHTAFLCSSSGAVLTSLGERPWMFDEAR